MREVDALHVWRGAAVVAMTVFHCLYIPDVMRDYRTRLSASAWAQELGTFARNSFMLLAGISLTLSRERHADFRAYSAAQVHRAAKMGAVALFMTAFTSACFPKYAVRFGVMHFLTVTVLLLHPFVGAHWSAHAGAAVLATAAHGHVSGRVSPFPMGSVLGYIGRYAAMDHFAVLRHLPTVLLGVVVGKLWAWDDARVTFAGSGALRWLGKHALEVYVLHWLPVWLVARWVVTGRRRS